MFLKGLNAKNHDVEEVGEVILSDTADAHQLYDTVNCHLEVFVILWIKLFEYHLHHSSVLREEIFEDFCGKGEANPSQESVHKPIL